MKIHSSIQLDDVRAVYSGSEFELWELVMGQQVHVGGLASSWQLAKKAGIAKGMVGIDLCCCTGAGMRFLVQCCQVARMRGIDATESVVQLGRLRCQQADLDDRIAFTVSDACHTGLADGEADFVWGEDAWCYVVDKADLIGEAARLVKPNGVIAFTDWIEGDAGLSDDEAHRLLRFMKFPTVQDLEGYADLLKASRCDVVVCEDTESFAPHIDLYLAVLESQLRYDALQIVGFDVDMLDAIIEEMRFMQQLAHAGKIAQGRFVARKIHGS